MRYSAFYQIVDGIVDELQVMVWPGETTPRRRLKNEQLEKLKYSVEKLIRDSVSIRHSTHRKALASIHLGKDHYKASIYNKMLTYRIHVERCFNGMIELGYLKIEKKGVHTTGGKRYLTRYSATKKMFTLFPQLSDVSAACLDVSRFRAAPGSHLGCYTFKSQGAFPA